MKDIIWPEYLYTFLKLIAPSPLEKKVLDCGAGGKCPPIALFKQKGYQSFGIDLSKDSIDAANAFAEQNHLELNIQFGDMRKLPFEDEFFSFVYTQNSICHLSKADTRIAIDEIQRVLRRGGYCLVDFMSIDCSFCNVEEMGQLIGDFEYRTTNENEDFLHSFYRDSEPDDYFSNMTIIRVDKIIKEHRAIKNPFIDVRLYYYVQKPD
ncbi:MAG: methyltransferase domain-containing protein [Candidatus Hodarchaeota archaeon]